MNSSHHKPLKVWLLMAGLLFCFASVSGGEPEKGQARKIQIYLDALSVLEPLPGKVREMEVLMREVETDAAASRQMRTSESTAFYRNKLHNSQQRLKALLSDFDEARKASAELSRLEPPSVLLEAHGKILKGLRHLDAAVAFADKNQFDQARNELKPYWDMNENYALWTEKA